MLAGVLLEWIIIIGTFIGVFLFVSGLIGLISSPPGTGLIRALINQR